jgi:hypothetical protein
VYQAVVRKSSGEPSRSGKCLEKRCAWIYDDIVKLEIEQTLL